MQMKKMTTCGRREMRALYEARQVNVAAPNTRVHYTGLRGAKGQPIVDREPARRKRRDHGTAEWGASLTATGKTLPRSMRRVLASVRGSRSMKEMLTIGETILRVGIAKANGR